MRMQPKAMQTLFRTCVDVSMGLGLHGGGFLRCSNSKCIPRMSAIFLLKCSVRFEI